MQHKRIRQGKALSRPGGPAIGHAVFSGGLYYRIIVGPKGQRHAVYFTAVKVFQHLFVQSDFVFKGGRVQFLQMGMSIGVAGDFVAVVQMGMPGVIDMTDLFSSLKIPRGGMGQKTGS